MMERVTHCYIFIDRLLNICPNIERNPIFPPKSALSVNFRSLGEKSGKVVGMKSNTAPTDAGEEEVRL
jgi:hypothetical protein